MADETKLTFFHRSKDSFKLASHLNAIANRKKRSLFSKFRLGTFDLEVESQRKNKTPREERICKICDTKEIENEIHFLLTCPTLSKSREPYLDNLQLLNSSFQSMSSEAKLEYMFFNSQLPQAELSVVADMLCCLKDYRDILLNKR